MAGNIGKIISPLIVVGLLGWWGYSWFARHQANSSVEEGNVEISQANELFTQTFAAQMRLLTDETMSQFPGNREKLRPEIERFAEAYAKVATMYRSAGAKSALAGQKDVDSTFKEYIDLVSKATNSLADSKDELSKRLLLLLDPTVQSEKDFVTKSVPITQAIQRFEQQSQALTRQADDLAAKTPTKIKR